MKERKLFTSNEQREDLAVIGLGYVGLPLAVEFSKYHKVIGFDINNARIESLKEGFDHTMEVGSDELKSSQSLSYTQNVADIASCTVFIVTVPTPIDAYKQPNLMPLKNATELVGTVLKSGDLVIFESTVFPGATEEICVPLLEEASGLKYNQDFYCGYSPERVNPGDKKHRVTTIKKVTSGSTPQIAERVDQLYNKIVTAGTHKTTSIRVAEAAKIIENTQRDVNIALINELSMIFNKLSLDTEEILEAAGTKWNFLPFRPGLVGGHCIGVDPYYLTYKAIKLGHQPEIILAGRRINDNMGRYVAEQVVMLMTKKRIHVLNSDVLVLGFSFKENCPDFRNTRVIDLIDHLKELNCRVHVFDPWIDKKSVALEEADDS